MVWFGKFIFIKFMHELAVDILIIIVFHPSGRIDGLGSHRKETSGLYLEGTTTSS